MDDLHDRLFWKLPIHTMATILIIDDEASILSLMTKLCEQMGHNVLVAQTGAEGVRLIETEKPDLVIVDLRIGDMNGLQIIEDTRNKHPDTAIIMVTGYGTVETAVEAMKLGAFDYLTKPFELEDLQRTVNRGLANAKAPVPTMDLAQAPEPVAASATHQVIGESERIRTVLAQVEKVADIARPVLLEGEFGTGKNLIARAIHNTSARKALPFKIIQCSALSEELLEQELFGFADAPSQTIFHRAHGGTVLIEEVELLSPRLQAQLNSFLEEIDKRRIGGKLSDEFDFRLIVSSTEELEQLVKDGKFRQDLFYHLNIIPIQLPALRHRKEDIILLANHFLEKYSQLTGTKAKEFDKFATSFIENYGWPGNVWELQNAVERACALADGDKVKPVDLPPNVTQKVEITDDDENTSQLPIGSTLSEYIKKQEKIFIRETLKYNEGSREKTASMLGVSIATLYRKMGLKLEREKALRGES